MPWWGKVLLGCGVGCAVLGVGAGALLITGLWWAFTPGAQIATEEVVTPDAVVVVHFSGEKNLEGVTQLASLFVTAMNEQQWRQSRRRLPESLRWLEPIMRMQEGQAGPAVGMWLPREVTVAVRPAESGTREASIAANFRTFVRPIRMILLHSDTCRGRIEKRRGADIVYLQGDAAICFAGGTLLWAKHASELDRVLGRVAAKSPPGRPAFLPAARYDGWKDAWSLAFFGDGRDERMRELVAGVLGACSEADSEGRSGGEPAPALGYVTAGVRLASADRIEAELVLAVPDSASAVRWQGLVETFLGRAAKLAETQRLTLAGTARRTPEGLVADVHLDGLAALVERWGAKAGRLPRAPLPTAAPGSEDEAHTTSSTACVR
jgi:hypothetical protein